MSNSIGLIESKGIVALIEAADVILKNSPVTILGIHKLENGLVSLAVIGNSDYVNAAIESGTEAGKRVGEIYASTVVNNPGKELLELFSELFSGNEVLKKFITPEEQNIDTSAALFTSVAKLAKTEFKREKSKPLLVTKISPVGRIKKKNDLHKNISASKLDGFLEKKIEDIKVQLEDRVEIPDSEKPLSTIERLRIEALGIENSKKISKKISIASEKANDKEIDKIPALKRGQIDMEALGKMNVHKLRHYAREFTEFPIKGRQISRANRDELIELFNTLKK